MRRPSPWHVIDETPLGDYRVFRVSALDARRQRDHHRYTFYRIDAADWVNVIAMTDANAMVMVRQFRIGSGKETLEIPGGVVDPGESPQQTAARELLEETGFEAGALRCIGAVSPNPALYANTLHTFLATGCRRVAEVRNDPSEETIVELIERRELPRLIRDGQVGHALVLAAFQWLVLHEDAERGDAP